uniref:Prostaglandin G/H synthase 2 n=1 Tax=Eptatretus burgeri TaxID=7764 RepID=A0A8C4N3U7_EPTBU
MMAKLFVVLCIAAVFARRAGAGDPCCGSPCENNGVCVSVGFEDYECDCTRTGYYGPNCTVPETWTWIVKMLKPRPDTVHYILTHFAPFWSLVNRIAFLQDSIMRYVLMSRAHMVSSPPTYNADYGYKSWEAYSNISYFTRLLPPVPQDCPTPMGTTGKKELPDAQQLAERFLLRRSFIPDPQGSNLLFTFFAQHFTHQFFKTDFKRGPGFTKALGHGVDLSHIYGDTLDKQHKLRLHNDGKLKFQMINGEAYPPLVSEAPVDMIYPPHVPEEARFAVGHEIFGLVPGLMLYGTLWLREHNRVCDILHADHPKWDDERIFQTARLILIGETIKIVIEDYVQHLSGYHFKLKFDPKLLFGQSFQYSNRISVEFNHLYHWHGLNPDSFRIGKQEYQYSQFLFNNTILLNHGIRGLLEAFNVQQAGRIGGGQNIHASILHVATASIKHGRKMRFQSLNQYRKHFGLKPYHSFEQLTGDTEMAADLAKLYSDINAMEFYLGLMVEKPRPEALFGETMVEAGAPFSLKGLMGNAICSPEYWKPSTFGGNRGFEIVNSASLRRLVCLNLARALSGCCISCTAGQPARCGQCDGLSGWQRWRDDDATLCGRAAE